MFPRLYNPEVKSNEQVIGLRAKPFVPPLLLLLLLWAVDATKGEGDGSGMLLLLEISADAWGPPAEKAAGSGGLMPFGD